MTSRGTSLGYERTSCKTAATERTSPQRQFYLRRSLIRPKRSVSTSSPQRSKSTSSLRRRPSPDPTRRATSSARTQPRLRHRVLLPRPVRTLDKLCETWSNGLFHPLLRRKPPCPSSTSLPSTLCRNRPSTSDRPPIRFRVSNQSLPPCTRRPLETHSSQHSHTLDPGIW